MIYYPTTPRITLPTAQSQIARTVSHKPMRELLESLLQSSSIFHSGASFTVSNPQHDSTQLAVHASTVMAVCNNGVAAIGHLLAHSALVIEDGTVGADTVEAIG